MSDSLSRYHDDTVDYMADCEKAGEPVLPFGPYSDHAYAVAGVADAIRRWEGLSPFVRENFARYGLPYDRTQLLGASQACRRKP